MRCGSRSSRRGTSRIETARGVNASASPLHPASTRDDTDPVDECCAPQGSDGYEREFDARVARRLAREYRSTGLTASLAIADHVAELLAG